ncbi:hypothetical protein ASPTUDRAFT_817777 [Aspergillus tubingensis CBS 134.48]|uniref:Uncharacterized protein n=1 Tax=Aspergillus tubingensis (strain CBS 134.48) TaxID=767770 RepID=A0A1L9MWD1_ASPTC|nr:hypothetical protein ASPTUDRAFT_817777 [Aspergillus tubingensis CBS 134.48]
MCQAFSAPQYKWQIKLSYHKQMICPTSAEKTSSHAVIGIRSMIICFIRILTHTPVYTVTHLSTAPWDSVRDLVGLPYTLVLTLAFGTTYYTRHYSLRNCYFIEGFQFLLYSLAPSHL